ncbi:MAG: S1/P1 nuclease [Chitinophagaceae bacterium]|nr:S1/P1 nuclease [Chitinophagaceae bacterium]
MAVFFCVPLNTFGWGMLGHRVVGGIAEHHLNPKARAAIKRILGNESLAMAASWADFIKSDRSYDYLGPWHYINVSSGKSYSQFMQYLQDDTATDLFTKLNLVISELKSGKLSKEKQVFYLKLLVHLVGDAHQPMHMGRPEDKGGNDIRVSWFGRPTNLHRVWDEHLVEFQQLSYTEHIAAINFTTVAQRDKWMRQPVKEWLYESYAAAQKIYSGVKMDDKLWYDYNFQFVGLMNEQLLKGGVRLAGLLNNIFGK